MHWARFLTFNALGAALWVGVWVCFGRLAGPHIGRIHHQARRYQLLLLVAFGVLVVALLARQLARRGRRGSWGRATQALLRDGSTGSGAGSPAWSSSQSRSAR
jgi:hypothetical protein